MILHGIHIDSPRFWELCRGARVRRVWVFGSILTDRFGPGSDIDLLIETDPSDPPGYLVLGGLQMELTDHFRRPVHLTTLGGVPLEKRASTVAGARLLHAA